MTTLGLLTCIAWYLTRVYFVQNICRKYLIKTFMVKETIRFLCYAKNNFPKLYNVANYLHILFPLWPIFPACNLCSQPLIVYLPGYQRVDSQSCFALSSVWKQSNHTLYTIPYTLYTIHYTLYTIHYALYTIHYTLYTIPCKILFEYWIIF